MGAVHKLSGGLDEESQERCSNGTELTNDHIILINLMKENPIFFWYISPFFPR